MKIFNFNNQSEKEIWENGFKIGLGLGLAIVFIYIMFFGG